MRSMVWKGVKRRNWKNREFGYENSKTLFPLFVVRDPMDKDGTEINQQSKTISLVEDARMNETIAGHLKIL